MIPNPPRPAEEKAAHLPSQTAGVVVSLQICAAHRAPMQRLDGVRALENVGLEGDRHAIPDSSRQVLFVEEEMLNRFGIPIGAVKENITTRGIELMHLTPGTRLRIREAVFQLTKPCTPCARMDEIRMGLQEALEGQRGMMAHVIRGGEIRVGDPVTIESESSR